ncbi:molybdenum cofactor guanylyltransferase [Methylosinus sp. R-45379]|uniref:molybdenum cofactor guanylyltransferase MobA n=1 Tax=Methylosinus sp. R-45379 TaxID=980563 RepID=UPI0007C98B1A|nr:molybdenum cofactor guanylyltransferase MobA [Methylosinus sp. R-45379]OAI24418.1 molybdenum cofactor guanylyltransferase [Methylosinus sp. R-45379]
MTRCFGLILAGGQARRMGGVAKPLISVGGAPILEHVVRRLAPQCARLALNANGDPARYAAFHLPIVPDEVEGFAGPLAGVLAGLDHVAAHLPDIPLMLSVPADTPFVPLDLAQRLASGRAEAKAEIAVATSGDRVHHAVALWPVALREELRHALVKEDLRKVSGFIERYANTQVEWSDTPYDPFFNVNRPEDIEQAERIAAGLETARS